MLSGRSEVVKMLVAVQHVSVCFIGSILSTSETRYRYREKLNDENAETENRLVDFTNRLLNWDFGL
jgi:hypothetical protein